MLIRRECYFPFRINKWPNLMLSHPLISKVSSKVNKRVAQNPFRPAHQMWNGLYNHQFGSLLQGASQALGQCWVRDPNLSVGLSLVFVYESLRHPKNYIKQVHKAPQHQDRWQAPQPRKRASYNILMPAFHRTNGGEHTAPIDIADCGHPKAWHVNAKKLLCKKPRNS